MDGDDVLDDQLVRDAGPDREPPGPARHRWAAALLNLTGLSLGYLYLRLRRRALVAGVVTVLLITGAATLRMESKPHFWQFALCLWLVATAYDGWRQGGDASHEPLSQGGGAGRWHPFAVAGLFLVAETVGYLLQGQAVDDRADQAFRTQLAGACRKGTDAYDWLNSGRYELSFDSGLGRAHDDARRCGLQYSAEQHAGKGEYRKAAQEYRGYWLGGSVPVWPGTVARIAQLDFAAAGELTAQARGRVGDVLAKPDYAGLADQQAEGRRQAAAEYRTALAAYAAVAEEHQGTPSARQVPKALDSLYAPVTTDLAQKRYCAAWVRLEILTEATAPEEASGAALQPPDGRLARKVAADLPEAAYQCGAVLYRDRNYLATAAVLDALTTDYPDSPAAVRAADMLIISQIRSADPASSQLPAPEPRGRYFSDVASSMSVTNATTSILRVLYTGPETGAFTLLPSATKSLTLEPGAYRVVVEDTAGTATRLIGDWNTSPGKAYSVSYRIKRPFDP